MSFSLFHFREGPTGSVSEQLGKSQDVHVLLPQKAVGGKGGFGFFLLV